MDAVRLSHPTRAISPGLTVPKGKKKTERKNSGHSKAAARYLLTNLAKVARTTANGEKSSRSDHIVFIALTINNFGTYHPASMISSSPARVKATAVLEKFRFRGQTNIISFDLSLIRKILELSWSKLCSIAHFDIFPGFHCPKPSNKACTDTPCRCPCPNISNTKKSQIKSSCSPFNAIVPVFCTQRPVSSSTHHDHPFAINGAEISQKKKKALEAESHCQFLRSDAPSNAKE